MGIPATPSDDLSWPRREPDKWRGFETTRAKVREAIEVLATDISADQELMTALDEIQGDLRNDDPNDVAYLLIKIIKPEL